MRANNCTTKCSLLYSSSLVVAACAISSQVVHAGQIHMVAQHAKGNQTGETWADAFVDLQDALDCVAAGDEIWVASGLYKPDRGTGIRTQSFILPSGVAVYGGFAGNETSRERRNWYQNPTILDGDLNGDDGPANSPDVSNCLEIRDEPGCDNAACEELICSRYDPDCCAGHPEQLDVWNSQCALTARHACCHLGIWHRCDNSHFVVRAIGTEPETTLDGVTISGSYYHYVADNDAYPYSVGAGVYVKDGSLTLTNCTFYANFFEAFQAENAIEIVLRHSTFLDQQSGFSASIYASKVVVDSCAFLGQSLTFFAHADDITVRNSSWDGDTGAHLEGSGKIESCSFENGYGLSAWNGVWNITDTVFLGNTKHLHTTSAVTTVDKCLFAGSTSGTANGPYASTLFRNCSFINNAPGRPAIGLSYGSLHLANCTILGNGLDLSQGGGAINLGTAASAQVRNSILWGNGAGHFQTREQDQIGVSTGSNLDIDYTIVEGWTGVWGGVGNFDADPMFVDPDGADDVVGTEDDDLRLSPDSPAIDAGDPNFVAVADETDLDGHARVLCGRVDIGAFEFGIGDFNCDRAVDLTDFAAWQDCVTGPTNPVASARGSDWQVCAAFDADGDGDADLHDLHLLYEVFVRP